MLYAEYRGNKVWASDFPDELANINTCKNGLEHYPHCPECGRRVTHHDQSIDGRTEHFAHCRQATSSSGGGGGGCAGATVGESDEHTAMKHIAASTIAFALDDLGIADLTVEADLAAPFSSKKHRTADCLIEFSSHDEQLGDGIIVETQWKNHKKDIQATTLDYLQLEQDYSVLWLWESDYDTSADHAHDWSLRLVHEQQVRDRVSGQIWPFGGDDTVWNGSYPFEHRMEIPPEDLPTYKSTMGAKTYIEEVREWQSDKDHKLPAPKLAGEPVDEIAQYYKENYLAKHGIEPLLQKADTDEYISEVANSGTTGPVVADITELFTPIPMDIWQTHKETIIKQSGPVNLNRLFAEGLAEDPSGVEIPVSIPGKEMQQLLENRPITTIDKNGLSMGDEMNSYCPHCSSLETRVYYREIKLGTTCRSCNQWFVFHKLGIREQTTTIKQSN